jgi:hypothetical protein
VAGGDEPSTQKKKNKKKKKKKRKKKPKKKGNKKNKNKTAATSRPFAACLESKRPSPHAASNADAHKSPNITTQPP